MTDTATSDDKDKKPVSAPPGYMSLENHEKALHEYRAFFEQATHQLRSPVTAIGGYAGILLAEKHGELTEQQRQFMETIIANANYMGALISNLIELNQIDMGERKPRPEKITLPTIWESVEKYFLKTRLDESRKNLFVEVNLTDNLPAVMADRHYTVLVLLSLLDNAIAYTPTGGKISVTAYHNPEEKGVVVKLTDTGIGIPDAHKPHIFDRFFRGMSYHTLIDETHGTGLELTIVRAYVQMLNGKIWFESEEGKGTTFYIQLPEAKKSEEG